MFAYVELNDSCNNGGRIIAPLSGAGLAFGEMPDGDVLIYEMSRPNVNVQAPSYEAIRVAMFAAGMVLDCTVAEADLTASLLSDDEAKADFAPAAITELEFAQATIVGLEMALNARDTELAAAKEALAEIVAIKGHLLRLAPIDEKFCHLTPADAVSELMQLWERQRTLIRQMQMDARGKAAELDVIKAELRYEREQRFGKAAAKSEGEAS